MTVELGLCVTAIVASSIIGYVFKMNTGLVAACFQFCGAKWNHRGPGRKNALSD